MEWAKVIELLVLNRLVAPESELGVHQRWYATTAMDVEWGTEDAVAAKDRLYRALDKALEHKEASSVIWPNIGRICSEPSVIYCRFPTKSLRGIGRT